VGAVAVIFVLLVVTAAVGVRSVWGFGDAMLAVPLLSLVIGLDQATPLITLTGALVAVSLLRERPELIERPRILRLLAGAVLGAPIGLYLLVGVPPAWAHAVLGLLLLGFGLWSLTGQRTGTGPSVRGPRTELALDLGFGLLAGVSSAAFNIAGPPMLLYAAARGWSADELRVNLQAVFLPLALLTMTGHALAGLWSVEVLGLAALALPLVWLTTRLAPRLRQRSSDRRGRVVVYGLIVALGLAELVRAAVALLGASGP